MLFEAYLARHNWTQDNHNRTHAISFPASLRLPGWIGSTRSQSAPDVTLFLALLLGDRNSLFRVLDAASDMQEIAANRIELSRAHTE